MRNTDSHDPMTSCMEVPPRSARALIVHKGQRLRVTDVAGGQPGDFVAFNLHDLSERFSQSRTRVENRACRITAGQTLWTNAQPPVVMFNVVADNAGGHDLLYAPCCRYALEKRFGTSADGCLENLARALTPWRLQIRDVPDPLNLFFAVNVTAEGVLAIGRPRSRTGDSIVLQAEMDCLVAISTCSVPLEGRKPSGYELQVCG